MTLAADIHYPALIRNMSPDVVIEIDDPEVVDLARQLADQLKIEVEDAILKALRGAVERERASKGSTAAAADVNDFS